MLIETSQLSGALLNYAAAIAVGLKEGVDFNIEEDSIVGIKDAKQGGGFYTIDPATGGGLNVLPIEVRYLSFYQFKHDRYMVNHDKHPETVAQFGADADEAALRCVVATKLGSRVDISQLTVDKLMQHQQ